MDIERINDFTVKFYLSYQDIENRGFSRDEVWYDRDKSEELFWGMMDELDDETEFELEGPVWIQIHAKQEGIEVVVTKAQVPEEDLDTPFDLDDFERMMEMEQEDILEKTKNGHHDVSSTLPKEKVNTFVFRDFDNIIPLAQIMVDYEPQLTMSLYAYEEAYYLCVSDVLGRPLTKDIASILLEYGEPSTVTHVMLQEYGKKIMEHDVFSQILHYFH